MWASFIKHACKYLPTRGWTITSYDHNNYYKYMINIKENIEFTNMNTKENKKKFHMCPTLRG
jgi:hypothetical protein